MKNAVAAVGFLALVAVAATFGAQFTPGDWYASLQKPVWTPPGWLFGPVWTTLYLMIAIAGWLEWRAARRSPALIAWFAQIIVNGAWSWLFFGLHRPGLAFADITLLLVSIVAFIVLARSLAARLLFIPYALWVGFAAALNFSILQMN